MSSIVALREAIQAAIREKIPEIVEVDWHDGVFDENDVEEITRYTPAAYVTVINAPVDEQLATGEMNLDVRVFVNIITSDSDSREERGSDAQVWRLMEKLAVLANFNAFAVPLCAPARGVMFKRLRDPELRRQGIAVGCVEWSNGLKIGRNAVLERDTLGEPPGRTYREAHVPISASMQRRPADGSMPPPEEIPDAFPSDD